MGRKNRNGTATWMAIETGTASLRRHVVSPGASLSGIVDYALAKAGVSRRVVAAVPYFLAALATVARTDLLATVPGRVARCHAPNFGLAIAVSPVPVRSFPVRMVWNRRLGADPALAWLRDRVREATKTALP